MPARDPHLLLAHAAWLRRLAQRLVGDATLADELVQDTWIAALRHPPSVERPVRPWLRHVLKNAARFRWRGEAHRAAREQAVAMRDGAALSSHELVERHETQQLLARLVTELDEPFRTAVLLRYAEGLAPSDIARRLGVPAGTIRWRLHEGIARLRAQLDALHDGERRTWVLALTPLLEGFVMAPVTKLVPVLVLLLALLVSIATAWLVVRPAPPATVASSSPPPSLEAPAAAPADRIPSLAAPPGWIAQAGVAARRVAGRVVADGAPVAGARVRLTSDLSLTGRSPARELRSDAHGRFDFGVQLARELTVSAAAADRLAAIEHVDLRDPGVTSDALELVLEPCLAALYGKVVDAAGTPIAHAQLLREDAIGSESTASGDYELCTRPRALTEQQLRVVVRADGYGAIMLDAGLPGRVRHDFVLSPEAVVAGRAIGPDGPVANARIWLERADATTRRETEQSARLIAATDDDGRFRFTGVAGGRHRVGGGSGATTATPLVVSVAAGGTREITLAMRAAGTLHGRVLRAGRPVAGAHVRTDDGASVEAVSQADGSFVLDGVPPGRVRLTASPYRVRSPDELGEDRARDVVLEVEPRGALRGLVRSRGELAPRARVCAGLLGAANACAFADAAGRFALVELAAGDYQLFADDARRDAAARGVRFTLAEGEQRSLDVELGNEQRIAGRVVDATGAAVPGVRVRVTCQPFLDDAECITGARGEFTCGPLAGACAYVPQVFAGPDTSVPFRLLDGAAPIVLAAGESRGAVRLVIDPERRAISGTVVDAAGAPIGDARVRTWGDRLEPDWLVPAPSALTGPDGAFRIAELAPGRYAIEVVTSEGVRRVERDVVAGTTGLTLAVDAALCASRRADAVDPLRAAIRRDEPADLATRPGGAVIWDEQVQLLGWDVPRSAAIGQPLEIALYYRVLRPIDRDWKVFVHFRGAHSWHNADHEPVTGRCATSTWQPSDVIVDRFTTTLAAEDRYQITVGLFTGWAPSWHNMPLSEAPVALRAGPDGVELATLTATKP